MSQRSSDSELNDIESALAGLVPVPSRLDRDRLMFQAGAASARVGVAGAVGLALDRGDTRGRPGFRVAGPGRPARAARDRKDRRRS